MFWTPRSCSVSVTARQLMKSWQQTLVRPSILSPFLSCVFLVFSSPPPFLSSFEVSLLSLLCASGFETQHSLLSPQNAATTNEFLWAPINHTPLKSIVFYL